MISNRNSLPLEKENNLCKQLLKEILPLLPPTSPMLLKGFPNHYERSKVPGKIKQYEFIT